jgi:hypothetical protein
LPGLTATTEHSPARGCGPSCCQGSGETARHRPAHVILQKNLADGRAGLAFTLFGAHIVSLTVEVLEPVEDTCWIMEPDQRCREVSFAQYAAAWAEDRVRSSRTRASAALHDAPASDS